MWVDSSPPKKKATSADSMHYHGRVTTGMTEKGGGIVFEGHRAWK